MLLNIRQDLNHVFARNLLKHLTESWKYCNPSCWDPLCWNPSCWDPSCWDPRLLNLMKRMWVEKRLQSTNLLYSSHCSSSCRQRLSPRQACFILQLEKPFAKLRESTFRQIWSSLDEKTSLQSRWKDISIGKYMKKTSIAKYLKKTSIAKYLKKTSIAKDMKKTSVAKYYLWLLRSSHFSCEDVFPA